MNGAETVIAEHRQWCEQRNHPGTTFNPLLGRTWCLCGDVITEGDTATHEWCCRHLPPLPERDA